MSQPRGASSRRLGAAPPPRPGEVSPGINFSPPTRRCLLPSCLPARLRSSLALSARSASPPPRRRPPTAPGQSRERSARLSRPARSRRPSRRGGFGLGRGWEEGDGGGSPPRRPHRAHGGRMPSGDRGMMPRHSYRRPLIRRGKLKPRAAVSAKPRGEGEAGGDKWPLGTPCASPMSPEAGHGCTGVRRGPDPGRQSMAAPKGRAAPSAQQVLLPPSLSARCSPADAACSRGQKCQHACVGHSPQLLGETKLGGRLLKMLLP